MRGSVIADCADITTSAELHEALRTCARHPPDPMLPEHLTWGHRVAATLVTELQGGPMAAALPATMDELLSSPDGRDVWLAIGLADPQVVSVEAVAKARALPADTLLAPATRDLASLWARVVAAGRIPWQPAFRAELQASHSGPLLGAAMVWDRAWALAHLDTLVGEEPFAVSTFAVAITTGLRKAEAEVWRMDLLRRQLTEGGAERYLETLDYYLSRDMLPDGGGVRWSR